MSLEEALKENTAAVKILTEAFVGGVMPDFLKRHQKEKGDAKTTTAAPGSTDETETKPAAGKKNKATGTTKAAAKEVKYEDLQPLVMKLAKADRDSAVSILSDFGVETARELDPSQYAEAFELFTKALKATGGAEEEGGLA